MHEYTINYTIKSVYEQLVKKAFFQLLVLPENTARQYVMEYDIECSLKDVEYSTENIFGFKVLHYPTQYPINEFEFTLNAKVVLEELNPYDFLHMDVEAEHNQLNDSNFYIDNILFLRPTELTKIPRSEVDTWLQLGNQQAVFDFLLKLNQMINSQMQYQTGVTTTDTTAREAMLLKKGVCQDYTHLFLAIARSWGIPARYVSGYLNHGGGHIGGSQTHAWAEALIPFVGWVGFDPTNNLLVDHHYIKIAHGTDYRDCSPITGIIETSGKQENTHIVSVVNQ